MPTIREEVDAAFAGLADSGFSDVAATAMVLSAVIGHASTFAPDDVRLIVDQLKDSIPRLETPAPPGEVVHDDISKRLLHLQGAGAVANAFADAFRALDVLMRMAPDQADRIIATLRETVTKLPIEN